MFRSIGSPEVRWALKTDRKTSPETFFVVPFAHDHVFEGWFASEDDLQAQSERGLVQCPVCGDSTVTRLPKPKAIRSKRYFRARLEPCSKPWPIL